VHGRRAEDDRELAKHPASGTVHAGTRDGELSLIKYRVYR
jgi:hypothetical protein